MIGKIDRTKGFVSVFTLVISIFITGCGAGAPNTSTQSESFGTDSSASQESINSDSPWLATEGDDGTGYTATCNFSGNEAAGDLVTCKIYWDGLNNSSIPQEYYGYTYLVVDGATYQSADQYADLRTVNPNAYAVSQGGYNTFKIPYGGLVSQLFKAEGPNEVHLLELPLNIQITNE